MFQKDIAISSNKKGPFVYGFIDLFSGSGESWNWGFGVDETSGINPSVPSHTGDGSKVKHEIQEKKLDRHAEPLNLQDIKKSSLLSSTVKLDSLEEDSEDGNKSIASTNSSRFLLEELVGSGGKAEKEVSNIPPFFVDNITCFYLIFSAQFCMNFTLHICSYCLFVILHILYHFSYLLLYLFNIKV